MRRLEFHISYKCDNNCLFCSERERLKEASLRFIPKEVAMRKLKEYSAKRFNHLTFTGGEPTLHPQFIPLVAFAKASGFKTYITTNGGLLYNKTFNKQAALYLDEICFSVHGHNPGLHNLHTGNNESFGVLKKAMENIENESSNIQGFANIVVTKYNFKHLESIVNFIANYKKLKQVLISNFAPEGGGLANFKDLAVPVGRFKEKIPVLAELILKKNIIPRFFGLPLCILKGNEDLSNDLHWSPRVTLEQCPAKEGRHLMQTLSYKPIRGRVKPVKCGNCLKMDICGGLFRTYYKEFGAEELEPYG